MTSTRKGSGDSSLDTPAPPHLDLPSETITGTYQAAVTRRGTEGTKGGQRGQLQGRWAAGSKCSRPQQRVSGAWAPAWGARGWGPCQGKVAFAWWG